MKCYHVLVHGRLDWSASLPPDDGAETTRPAGFYCHRYVLASTIRDAQETAFRSVRRNLDSQTGWIRERTVRLDLEAEETSTAPIYRLLKSGNRGHVFYEEE